MIPGINLFNIATSLITQQRVSYYKNTGRTTNSIGLDVATYASPITIIGSFQPVAKRLYDQLGLDFGKNYFTLYTNNDITDLKRDVSGDKIVYNNQEFQCESNTPWFGADGWMEVLCVYIQDV